MSGMSRYFESEQAFFQRIDDLKLTDLKAKFVERN